jgi:hypothetical protein
MPYMRAKRILGFVAAVAVAGLVAMSTTLLTRATATERSRRLLAGLVSTDATPTPKPMLRVPRNVLVATGAVAAWFLGGRLAGIAGSIAMISVVLAAPTMVARRRKRRRERAVAEELHQRDRGDEVDHRIGDGDIEEGDENRTRWGHRPQGLHGNGMPIGDRIGTDSARPTQPSTDYNEADKPVQFPHRAMLLPCCGVPRACPLWAGRLDSASERHTNDAMSGHSGVYRVVDAPRRGGIVA